LLLTIEKLIYGGDGLSHLPADARGRGKAVFVPFTLGGEQVEATLTEQKPGFARARVDAVIELSPHRIDPKCPYFARCGGCHYQHSSYEHQLEIKQEILRETLRRVAKVELPAEIEVHPSPPWNYRNRSRLQVRVNPTFAAGYFRLASHDLLPVEECPISSPLINRGIAALWQSGHVGKVPAGLREIEFFANADDSQMLVELRCTHEARRASVRGWVEELRAALPEIAGAVAFRETEQDTNAAEKLVSDGDQVLTYKTQRGDYRVSAGAFFQINRHLTDELVKIVTADQSGTVALDLYAGVGFFSTALGAFERVISVESSQTSAADLAYNQPANGKAVQATAEHYLGRAGISEETSSAPTALSQTGNDANTYANIDAKPDFVIVDPPRSGLGERVARSLANLGAARLTYVSCDPATLARDLVILLAAGYRIERAHLVDLFPQTYHLESVIQLTR
jgi:23S rRNA (uracil1939-C5)-methyltransferase